MKYHHYPRKADIYIYTRIIAASFIPLYPTYIPILVNSGLNFHSHFLFSQRRKLGNQAPRRQAKRLSRALTKLSRPEAAKHFAPEAVGDRGGEPFMGFNLV